MTLLFANMGFFRSYLLVIATCLVLAVVGFVAKEQTINDTILETLWGGLFIGAIVGFFAVMIFRSDFFMPESLFIPLLVVVVISGYGVLLMFHPLFHGGNIFTIGTGAGIVGGTAGGLYFGYIHENS